MAEKTLAPFDSIPSFESPTPPPRIIFKSEVESLESQERTKRSLTHHYVRVRRILKTEKEPVLPVVVRSMPGNQTGMIYEDRILVRDSLPPYIFELPNLDRNLLPQIRLAMQVSLLAHELYHQRQMRLFPDFYNARQKAYVHFEENKEAYYNQTLEVGARAFEKKYMQHVMDRLEKSHDLEDIKLAQGMKFYMEAKEAKEEAMMKRSYLDD